MRILVTGGCGFIGSHLISRLVAEGHEAVVVDDLSTGSTDNLPPHGAHLLQGDIRDRSLMDHAVAGVDGIVHLAAIASVERCTRDWQDSHSINIGAFVGLLECVAKSDHPKIPVVYASSAAVYGDCDRLPLGETEHVMPISAYGADKLACEQHARVAARIFGLHTVGLRFFNVFGPRQDPTSPYSGVISIFARRCLAGQPMRIFGDGGQSRDFIHVSDIVAALCAALEKAGPEPQVFNVCTGGATTVRELAEQVAAAAGQVPRIETGPERPGDIRHSIGDPSRLNRVLEVTARTPLDEGLKTVTDWLAAEFAAAGAEDQL
ncbi:NAD-dependent epimerase/dehydratase family protein [Marinibaculum pumilum]|uniref:NAD-dependent epimerase/dehydratase family protein n=1 Tax=Marinibaculum pumilum TaxID=1766165 RepID=A0ABV7KWT6_9PROT